MPLPDALRTLRAVIDWANSDGDAYTNGSTGLHMGVSIPHKGGDVDYVKLIMFLGDRYVLDQFGRSANSYTRSALDKLKDVQRSRRSTNEAEGLTGAEKTAAAMELMKRNLIELAQRYVQDGVGRDKYTSAHIKPGYIEFRSPGGDYLAEVNVDMDVLDSYVKATYPDLRKCLNLVQLNSQGGELKQPSATDKSARDWRLDCVDLFKQGRTREARTLICQSSTPEEADDIFRWMYDNLDLWARDPERQDEAVIIIRNGLVNVPLVADQEINLSATLAELCQLS
jgi:hypothetical protein